MPHGSRQAIAPSDLLSPKYRFPLPPLAFPLLAPALAWLLLLVCFPVQEQDFPLNDDWAFGRGAFLFARGEGIHYGNWASMPQLGQWLWACPFLWLLGSSFFALRLSTVVLSWLGLWALYYLLRQHGQTPARAALAVTVLAFHPLFFLLTGTFMTDVPALSFALLGLAFYVRAFTRQSVGWLIAACLVATMAAITRQNTVSVALVAAILLWRIPTLSTKPLWWLGALFPFVAGIAVHFWFGRRNDVRAAELVLLPTPYRWQLPFIVLHFAGLTTLPLLLLWPRVRSWKTLAVSLGLMLVCAAYWYQQGATMPYPVHENKRGLFPYTDNMLTPYGAFAGSRLGGGRFVVGERPLLLGIPSRSALSILGCLAGALLIARGRDQWRREMWCQPLILFTLLQLPFLLLVEGIYDRYLLFLLPGALLLALPPMNEKE